MKAVRYIATGKPPEIVDIPKPEPGPGQIRIRVAGAGVCHSDAQAGRIHADVEVFPLEQAVEVYDRLRHGRIRGRAVLKP